MQSYYCFPYVTDSSFGNVFNVCEKVAFGKFYRHNGFLFRENKLYVPQSYLHDLLVREAHRGGLMGHFGISNTLDVLYEHLFWPHMKCDVQKICERCISYIEAQSRVQPLVCIHFFLYLVIYGFIFYGICVGST